MPQLKPTLLDRLFGGGRREPVPHVKKTKAEAVETLPPAPPRPEEPQRAPLPPVNYTETIRAPASMGQPLDAQNDLARALGMAQSQTQMQNAYANLQQQQQLEQAFWLGGRPLPKNWGGK
jgi:hypothetical protein